jgi:outer membrane protein assembly factor BamD (BamD/ComL family)
MRFQLFGKFIGLLLITSTLYLLSCEGSAEKSGEKEKSVEVSIAEMEKEFFSETQTKMDKRKALDLVKLYVQFADENPSNPQSPDYLFKAADISMNLNRPQQTIKLFDRILTAYPSSDKAPSALFLKAFVYEDQMQDYDKAKKYYELFLKEYPNSEFADDAEVSIKNLGKTPEELIKEFEKNNP